MPLLFFAILYVSYLRTTMYQHLSFGEFTVFLGLLFLIIIETYSSLLPFALKHMEQLFGSEGCIAEDLLITLKDGYTPLTFAEEAGVQNIDYAVWLLNLAQGNTLEETDLTKTSFWQMLRTCWVETCTALRVDCREDWLGVLLAAMLLFALWNALQLHRQRIGLVCFIVSPVIYFSSFSLNCIHSPAFFFRSIIMAHSSGPLSLPFSLYFSPCYQIGTLICTSKGLIPS